MATKLKFDAASGLEVTQTGPDEYTIRANAGTVGAHGALSGLGNDDHLQYLTVARHDAIDAADHSSGAAPMFSVLTADGVGGADWLGVGAALLPPAVPSAHVISTVTFVPAGYSASVVRYLELAASAELELRADSDMEIT